MKIIKPKYCIAVVLFSLAFVYFVNGSVTKELTQEELSSFYGGLLCDIDCEDQTTGCSTRDNCTEVNPDSPNCDTDKIVCGDQTMDRACTKNTTFGLACKVVTPAHSCGPKEKQSGACSGTYPIRCQYYVGDVSPSCGTTATKCEH